MAQTINGSIYTYEVAPCYTLMENSLYEHMRKILGWEAVDGTMTPGGSFANFMAIHLARHRIHPEFTKKGIYGCKPMKVITSEVSHYSMKKGVNLCGIGTDNIIYVKVDENRRMIPSELAKVIEDQKNQGNDILLVNSTVGTTVEGSIDPVKEIG
jgi:sulfinoalanine decarboxylase